MKGTGFCSALSCGYHLFHNRHIWLQLLQLMNMPQCFLATGRDPVAIDLALHSLGQTVLDEQLYAWHHSMEIQVAGIYNLCLICPHHPHPAHLQNFT